MSTQKIITDSDKSPLVQVLTLMFLVIAILSCGVRMGTKLHMIKALRADDILVLVATALAVGQSVAVWVACENGLGRHYDTLSATNRDAFFKSQYAFNILFVASLLCCKVSGVMSLQMMTQKNQKWLTLGCQIVVGIWGVTALIVNLFQCQLPSPWNYDNSTVCINQTAFWTYYSIANIVTDVFITIVMCENVLKIQTSLSKKILVMSVFGSRMLVTPAIAVQIYFTNTAFSSSNHTFSFWEASISIQLVQCLTILTVCIPNFKPFMDSIESGQIRIDDLRRQAQSSGQSYGSKKLGYKSNQNSNNISASNNTNSKSRRIRTTENDTTKSQHSQLFEMVDMKKTGTRRHKEDGNGSWDGQSRTSQSSQTILIHQTWQVEVQNMHERATATGERP